MAKAFVSFNDDTVTGAVIGDLTVSYCKDIDGGAVSSASCVLTELGLGEYILENPNVTTKRVVMRCYLTADSTKKFRCAFDPADGNIALEAGGNLEDIKNALIIKIGTVVDATPTTLKIETSLTEAVADYWNNGAILWSAGSANAGVIRSIKDYKVDNGEITFNTALPVTPVNGDAFAIIMLRAFKLAGLEAQEIRDAMKLAPSAGDPAAGSIDKHLDDTETIVTRALGLTLENHVEDDIVRDANGLKTSSIIYLYDSAANATTHDKVTGLVAKYNVSVTYDSNRRLQKLTTVKA